MALALIMKLNGVIGSTISLFIGLILVIFSATMWWYDIRIEGSYKGEHTKEVEKGIKIGILLFYVSETCLFASLFWAFLHSTLSPSILLGSNWPPLGIISIDAYGIPLLNLIILLSSGAVLTWGHERLIASKKNSSSSSSFIIFSTILIGLLFVLIQFIEFSLSNISLSDGVFGSSFFIIVTCHMIHVIIGATFLLISFLRISDFTSSHHLGFSAAIIYWHLVDIIYLFVFIIVYYSSS